ncbi:hypothetical protein C8F04DRAFT_1250862 [Mycena alexandri]|uniref:Uncharacterized protein n=1 Tax=Mycena alexandri TaxID=1745969 RepID=A0AAD6TBM8_9AGAR|nr:hypothetical protein C8F04DRAFT_1250854 [Mycena alexandri]KAJ7043434.1 hypothetical protein C8F04DRAFT_1250862 [Mycena alexandri]
MPPNNRCKPRYFPQPGHEDTVDHDGRKDGRYFVVGVGRCGGGVFTDPKVADQQTDGFSGYVKRAVKRWAGVGGVEDLWASICDQYHQDGCHHNDRLPDGWEAPTPVVRGCAPAPPAAAPAPPAPPVAAPPAAAPHAAPPAPAPPAAAPKTPRPTTKTGGSGNTLASPFFVSSSQSPSPLRPPQYNSIAANISGSPRPRAPLNPNGGAQSTSAGSSVLSAMSTTSSSSSLSYSSRAPLASPARTPKKPSSQSSRVQSSPNGGYDTDYFYADDSDEHSDSGPAATQQQRLWAVRGLETIFDNEDDAFDALRQNIRRLKYMQLLSSTSLAKLRRFAAS